MFRTNIEAIMRRKGLNLLMFVITYPTGRATVDAETRVYSEYRRSTVVLLMTTNDATVLI